MRKQIPPDKTNSVLEFATKRPNERLRSICNGLNVRTSCTHSATLLTIHSKVLDYGQSEYVRQFGMTAADQPLKTQARVINPPTLKYHQSSKQPSVVSIPSLLQMEDDSKNFYSRDQEMGHGTCMSLCRSLILV